MSEPAGRRTVARSRALAAVLWVAVAPLGGQQQPATPPARDIYFAPTLHAVADAMLRLAGVTADDVVYDLGSGDGRIVILAAEKYGARGVGIEIDPQLVAISREVALGTTVGDRVAFLEGDLFAADISAATVVTLYLSAGANRRLEPKLRQELRPGTRIVSHQFPIGRWPPERTLRAPDGTDLFLWTVPPREPDLDANARRGQILPGPASCASSLRTRSCADERWRS